MKVLTYGLNWCSAYDDQVESQTCINIQLNLPVTRDMLTGCRQYVNPITQAQTEQQTYFQQVSDLAFKALKICMIHN